MFEEFARAFLDNKDNPNISPKDDCLKRSVGFETEDQIWQLPLSNCIYAKKINGFKEFWEWRIQWWHEYKKRQAVSEAKARKFLEENLTTEQLNSLLSNNCFDVISPEGKPCRIYASEKHNNVSVDGITYCSIIDAPRSDLILAQKLILETCPKIFFDAAHRIGPEVT